MTGPAVDLAALRSARTALAAIVAEHPELTGAAARARLAAHLPEIIAMPPRLDPDSADSTIVGVRMTPEMLRALDAEVSRQRGLNPDVSIGRSNVLRGIVRRALLGSIATPSTSSPAPSPAPAPSRPVVARVEAVEAPATPGVEALAAEVARARALPAMLAAEDRAAPPVDPRQLPLLAPVALHNAANGANVASRIGNDNATSPAEPKRVEAPASTIDAATVAARIRALSAAEIARRVPKAERQWSFSAIAQRAGVSKSLVGKLVSGDSVSPASVAMVAAILAAE